MGRIGIYLPDDLEEILDKKVKSSNPETTRSGVIQEALINFCQDEPEFIQQREEKMEKQLKENKKALKKLKELRRKAKEDKARKKKKMEEHDSPHFR